MHTGDTIVALATGWASSRRALVRVSGPHVPALLESCVEPAMLMPVRAAFGPARVKLSAAWPPADRGGFRCRVTAGATGTETGGRSNSLSVLPILLGVYPGPRTYTGEHSAELVLPGNPRLVERLIASLLDQPGVREAAPGEFSARAYLNGRLTLAQAEGVAATIAARNEDELAAARRVLLGETGRDHARWVDELVSLLAAVESGIDFTDQEDVVPIPPAALLERLRVLASELSEHLGAARGGERAGSEPRVVLAGAPNAGKSTLFNALLGRARAVVSPVAGTTRDVIEEPLDLSDAAPALVVRLVDLAGLDESRGVGGEESERAAKACTHTAAAGGREAATIRQVEADAQQRARAAIEGADVIVHCDPTGAFRDLPMGAHDGQAMPIVLRVRTKSDLPASRASGAVEEGAGGGGDGGGDGGGGTLPVCALDGWNLGPLRRAIGDAACRDHASAAMSVLPRHRRGLALALAAIAEAVRTLESQRGERAIAAPELVAGSLRVALDAMSELTGRVSPDDVIGRIFATFCIGK